MPRKASRSIAASASRSSSKRAAPEMATLTRQSKRTRATPLKSPYFEPDSEDDAKAVNTPSPEDADEGDYEESNKEATESESEPEPSTDEDAKPKRSAKKAAIPMRKKSGEKELWKQGAKLELGTQVVLKKPKARAAGDVRTV